MKEIEDLLRMVEGQRSNMEHFVEHMGVILNNVEDNLTKELLSHLIEEEEERAVSVNELIQAIREWQAGDGTANVEGLASAIAAVGGESLRSTGARKRLTVGSLVQY
ncbi:hypothetical protein [Effusibacillus consociatus]|uniref:Uncharacterized protein n=1 Tax=Effusibacillus consociatus TaxID=1117041 RepID=A0ABV9Q542_9BACL